MEKSQWLTDRLCCSNFLSHARFTGPLEEDILRRALCALQARHPLLRVRIVRECRGHARFVDDAPAPIAVRSVTSPAGEWTGEAEREPNTRFGAERAPLLRCVRIEHETKRHTVLLAFHHAIGDGLSGAYLMRDLYASVDALLRGQDPSLPPLAPRPAMEAHFPAWVKGARGRRVHLNFVTDYVGLDLGRVRPARLAGDGRAPLEKRSVHLHAARIPGSVLERLHSRARQRTRPPCTAPCWRP